MSDKKTVLIPADHALTLVPIYNLESVGDPRTVYSKDVYEYHEEYGEANRYVVRRYVAFETTQSRGDPVFAHRGIHPDWLEEEDDTPGTFFVRALIMEPYTVTKYREAS